MFKVSQEMIMKKKEKKQLNFLKEQEENRKIIRFVNLFLIYKTKEKITTKISSRL